MDDTTRESSANNPQAASGDDANPTPAWKPLTSRQRRIVGVLVEKAKTTPDSYPLTLNALANGCNQKSNRSPQMNLTPDDVEELIDELRELGAVTEIQGGGRVNKYRHRLYEWLGVSKVELAVMAELLLRGEQTIGELRGRAARMEPIADLSELKPIVRGLIERNLVVSLTPEGRGQIVTHNLYQPRELEAIRERVGSGDTASEAPARPAANTPSSDSSADSRSTGASEISGEARESAQIDDLQSQINELRSEVETLKQRLDELK